MGTPMYGGGWKGEKGEERIKADLKKKKTFAKTWMERVHLAFLELGGETNARIYDRR